MKRSVRITKILLTFTAIYFAFHAVQALALRLAEDNLQGTLTFLQHGILTASGLFFILAAIQIWRDVK